MLAVEVLTWRAKAGISDTQMVEAVEAMVVDLKKLPGFEYQALFKVDDNLWKEVYFWKTEHDAHRSNELMADKNTFKVLMALIEPDSVTMEVAPILQQSSEVTFG